MAALNNVFLVFFHEFLLKLRRQGFTLGSS